MWRLKQVVVAGSDNALSAAPPRDHPPPETFSPLNNRGPYLPFHLVGAVATYLQQRLCICQVGCQGEGKAPQPLRLAGLQP